MLQLIIFSNIMYTLITDCFYALLVISLEEARPAARPGEHEIRNLYQFQKSFTFFQNSN